MISGHLDHVFITQIESSGVVMDARLLLWVAEEMGVSVSWPFVASPLEVEQTA